MEDIVLTKIGHFEKINDKEIDLRDCFVSLKSIITDQCLINVKRQRLSDFIGYDDNNYKCTIKALIFHFLVEKDISNINSLFDLLYLVNKDEFNCFVASLKEFIISSYKKFLESTYSRIIHLLSIIKGISFQHFISLLSLLLRCFYFKSLNQNSVDDFIDDLTFFSNLLSLIENKFNDILDNFSNTSRDFMCLLLIKILRIFPETKSIQKYIDSLPMEVFSFTNNSNIENSENINLINKLVLVCKSCNGKIIEIIKIIIKKRKEVIKFAGKEIFRLILSLSNINDEEIKELLEIVKDCYNNNNYSNKEIEISSSLLTKSLIPPHIEKHIEFLFSLFSKTEPSSYILSFNIFFHSLGLIDSNANLKFKQDQVSSNNNTNFNALNMIIKEIQFISNGIIVDIARYIIVNHSHIKDSNNSWKFIQEIFHNLKNENMLIRSQVKEAIFFDWLYPENSETMKKINCFICGISLIFNCINDNFSLSSELIEFIYLYAKNYDYNRLKIVSKIFYYFIKNKHCPQKEYIIESIFINEKVKKMFNEIMEYENEFKDIGEMQLNSNKNSDKDDSFSENNNLQLKEIEEPPSISNALKSNILTKSKLDLMPNLDTKNNSKSSINTMNTISTSNKSKESSNSKQNKSKEIYDLNRLTDNDDSLSETTNNYFSNNKKVNSKHSENLQKLITLEILQEMDKKNSPLNFLRIMEKLKDYKNKEKINEISDEATLYLSGIFESNLKEINFDFTMFCVGISKIEINSIFPLIMIDYYYKLGKGNFEFFRLVIIKLSKSYSLMFHFIFYYYSSVLSALKSSEDVKTNNKQNIIALKSSLDILFNHKTKENIIYFAISSVLNDNCKVFGFIIEFGMDLFEIYIKDNAEIISYILSCLENSFYVNIVKNIQLKKICLIESNLIQFIKIIINGIQSNSFISKCYKEFNSTKIDFFIGFKDLERLSNFVFSHNIEKMFSVKDLIIESTKIIKESCKSSESDNNKRIIIPLNISNYLLHLNKCLMSQPFDFSSNLFSFKDLSTLFSIPSILSDHIINLIISLLSKIYIQNNTNFIRKANNNNNQTNNSNNNQININSNVDYDSDQIAITTKFKILSSSIDEFLKVNNEEERHNCLRICVQLIKNERIIKSGSGLFLSNQSENVFNIEALVKLLKLHFPNIDELTNKC